MTNNDPGLFFAEDGAPRSARFGDIYYSLQDGLAESRAVFLEGCHLPQGWAGRERFTVLELGFGTGLNIVALMQLWATHRPDGHLHVFSIEGFLMDREAAARALSAWPELAPYASALLEQWPAARSGFHYMDFPQWGISLTLGLMDVGQALTAWRGQADAVFLDGFSPALNADMWSEAILAEVGAHCRPGTRLATFTVAGFVRRGLQAAGFAVAKCPGHGRKRERLEAEFTNGHELSRCLARCLARPLARRIAVVGAGVGGCALVHQARRLGLEVDLFDGEGIGAGASGNAAALVTPRLDAGNNAISALFADAYAYAGALYRRLCPQAIIGEGLSQFAGSARDVSRFARIARQTLFTPGDLETFAVGGDPDVPALEGIHLNHALWVRPREVLAALLDGQAPIISHVVPDGYDAVILAMGEGIFDHPDVAGRFDLRPVRGQVEFAPAQAAPRRALSWGGYAVPLDGGLLFGATHERGDRGSDVRDADRARNLESLAKVMPQRVAELNPGALQSRAGIRVMTRDYLPALGRVGEGLYALTGLGARGFSLAPLLAKALLAEITGAPPVLPAGTESLLNLNRLTLDPTVSPRP